MIESNPALNLSLRRKRLREVAGMRNAIDQYRQGNLDLHSLVGGLETLLHEIDDEQFSRNAHELILNMEIVNAVSRSTGITEPLSRRDLDYVEEQLRLMSAEIDATRF